MIAVTVLKSYLDERDAEELDWRLRNAWGDRVPEILTDDEISRLVEESKVGWDNSLLSPSILYAVAMEMRNNREGGTT